MPGTRDLVIAAIIAIVYPLYDRFAGWPRMMRAIRDGRANARLAIYAEVIAVLWGLSALVAYAFRNAGRSSAALGLVAPGLGPIVVTVVLGVALLVLFRMQMMTIGRLDEAKRVRVRARQGDEAELVPRTTRERAVYVLVACTAGICEELLYRGFLVWALQPWLGLWGAALASTLSFASAHAYQGRAGVVRSGVLGAGFAVLAILSGSIVPGIVLHALIDLIGGESGHSLYAPARDRVAGA